MASYNKVILIGNLTRDPELRYTPKGMAIAKLGIAVNRTWRNEAGESKEEVTFIDVDAFGRQAETLAQYLKKGSPLMIEGRLKLDQWDDKQTGQKRSKMGVVLEGFQFLGGGKGGGEAAGSDAAPRARPATPAAKGESSDEPPMPEDDDVPF
ncbi:MAG TPA: single-stranded DNA-binding protein [Verrucomicrobiae bacterium]|nr:single-stranded DNA-binding protein [Verrucomicrobiae bacterium]